MNFELNESQKMLKMAARGFLEKECPKSIVRESQASELGYLPRLWHKIADLGWTGMLFPKQYGGEGADLLDIVPIYEEMGRALLPSPHLVSVVLSGLTILRCGGEQMRREFVPRIARGELVLTLALTEPELGWDAAQITATGTRDEDNYVIKGTKLFVPYANAADYMLVAANTGDGTAEQSISLFIIDSRNSPGLSCIPIHGDFAEPLCEVIFDNVKIPKSNIVGEINKAWPHLKEVLKVGTVLQCAEVVGGIDYVLQLVINFSKERVQFGQYVGSFQRVQDRIFNIVGDLDKARWASYEAAWRLSEGLPCNIDVSAAKILSCVAYNTACQEAAHVLAGVGFMKDFDLWLYHKKAWTTEHFLGGSDFHRQIVGRELFDSLD